MTTNNIKFEFPKEIVAARINNIITNDPKTIMKYIGNVTEWLDRDRMKFMANCDLSSNWVKLAKSPILFLINKDGSMSSPYIHDSGLSSNNLVKNPISFINEY